MTDFTAARRIMVDSQVRTSDVTDARLIAAMLAVPRERFLPAAQADLAYLDFDVPVTVVQADRPARRLLKPMVLAKLVQAAEVAGGDHVLDVGGATGYASAVLARLAGSVVALEEDLVVQFVQSSYIGSPRAGDEPWPIGKPAGRSRKRARISANSSLVR